MEEERRLVWRVLRHWKEVSVSGRFPGRDEIDPWLQGEDGKNCLLIAVESPIELSHFVAVGVNLAVALCSTDTLAVLLLSRAPRVVAARRCLIVEGGGDASRGKHSLPQRAAPALGGRPCDRLCAGRRELSLAARRRDAGSENRIPESALPYLIDL